MCRDFRLFGSGDRLFIVSDGKDGEEVFIIENPCVQGLTYRADLIEMHDACGFRKFSPGPRTTEISIIGGRTEHITGKDLSSIYDPVMSKTILELLRGVDKKLKQRGST